MWFPEGDGMEQSAVCADCVAQTHKKRIVAVDRNVVFTPVFMIMLRLFGCPESGLLN